MMPAPILRVATVCALLLFSGAYSTQVFARDTLQIAARSDQQPLLADAETLLLSGHSDAAYTLLSAREAELAGNPYFDYLLGVAALDSGRLSDAIFSLRRSVAVSPGFSGARMELARAYFDSGNTALARPLFVRLLHERPPAAVHTIINHYLASIDAALSQPKSRLSYAFDVVAGYDDNANGSTDNQQFLGFTLSPENLKTASSFFEAGAGFSWNHPSSTRFGWYTGGRARLRHNPDASFVDSGIIGGKAGIHWQRGRFFGRAGADGYWSTRDGDPNQSYIGLDALLGNRIAQNWDLTFSLRGGALRHDRSIEILDVDRILYSGGLTFRFAASGNIGIEAIGGKDTERNGASAYGNSKFGGRLTLSVPVGRYGTLYASTGSLGSEYDGLFFGTTRKDTQVSSLLQFSFRDVWVDGLTLTPKIRYVSNDSNVALYDYDRTEVGLQLGWTPQ